MRTYRRSTGSRGTSAWYSPIERSISYGFPCRSKAVGRYKQITSTVYFFYPNTIMMVDAFGVDLMRIFPLGGSPSKSRTIHTWYIDPRIRKHFQEQGMSYEDQAC